MEGHFGESTPQARFALILMLELTWHMMHQRAWDLAHGCSPLRMVAPALLQCHK